MSSSVTERWRPAAHLGSRAGCPGLQVRGEGRQRSDPKALAIAFGRTACGVESLAWTLLGLPLFVADPWNPTIRTLPRAKPHDWICETQGLFDDQSPR